MYFAHFTVSGVSAPLLCDSVFASCCGKHNIAMIAHAFQKAQNTAEEPKHFLSLSLSISSASASVSPLSLTHFQPRYSAPMIANTHNDSISRGPAEVPHWCWETLSCRHIAGNFSAMRTGTWWALARHHQKLGWLCFFFFLLIKWSANCGRLVCIGTAHCFLPLRGQGERHGSISVNTL